MRVEGRQPTNGSALPADACPYPRPFALDFTDCEVFVAINHPRTGATLGSGRSI